MTKEAIMESLQNFVNEYHIWNKVEDIIYKAYIKFNREHDNCYIINDKYICIDGYDFWLMRSKANECWVVKPMK